MGFKTADRIARSVGIGADAPERAQAGVFQVLHDLSAKGHVYTTRGELAQHAALMLERPVEDVDLATNALAEASRVQDRSGSRAGRRRSTPSRSTRRRCGSRSGSAR